MDPNYVHQESTTTLAHINDFDLQDFIDDPNFDQFINLILGENKDADAINNFDHSSLINGSLVDNTNNNPFISFPPNALFDQCNNNDDDCDAVNVCDPSSTTLSSFSCFDDDEEVKGDEELGEENGDDEDSSATTITNNDRSKTRPKTDRSKTLISERRRRGRMKEKLYALRSLVPNITKMDKASIIGDAVSYVHELQAQTKKLKTEVAGLEASLLVSEKYQGKIQNPIKVQFTSNNLPSCKKIIQMDMFQVDERGFYVKIVCNKGEGVAASLYKSLESLAVFNNVQNSNLATASNNFLLTFLLSVKGHMSEVNLPNLRLWVTGAFLSQGFEFIPSFLA